MNDSKDIVYKEESYKIIGACMKVYRELGSGFLESVYQKALQKEFLAQGIPFDQQVKLNVFYREKQLDNFLRLIFCATTK